MEGKIDSIGGIEYTTFGELDKREAKTFIFVLHGRGGKREDVFYFCKDLAKIKNVVAVTFDHRNHGKRVIDPLQNANLSLNPNHVTDMYAMQLGSARDVTFLVDILPIKYNLTHASKFGVVGISLGAHSSLLVMAHDIRISFCVSMIGCGDYKSLMQKRQGVDMEKHFPTALQNLVASNDPVNNIAAFTNKHIFLAQGSEDKLVPAECNKEFYELVKEVAKDVIFKCYPHGHVVPPEMVKDVIEWIIARVAGSSKL